MNRKEFDVAAGIAERMDKLEKTIFELESLKDKKSYRIIGYDSDLPKDYQILTSSSGTSGSAGVSVDLNSNEIATEVFLQGILQYYIDNLNLELDELRKSFEEI